MMKILYLTGDNRIRASAFSLFVPLYNELLSTGFVNLFETDIHKMDTTNHRKDIFEGNNTDYIEKCLDVDYVNDNFDMVVIENLFPYWNEDWHKMKVKKVLILGDLHRFNPKGNRYTNFMFKIKERMGISAIFTKYIETYERDFIDVNLPAYHWPHSIDPSIFLNYGLEKEYGVLSTGIISDSVYPIRNRLYNLLKDKNYFKRIERPHNNTYVHPNPWPVGIDYAQELNKSKLSIACTSVYHYTIAKIFEIPACNSVLLCDYTKEMEALGFIPDKNFIEIPKENEVEYIEHMLNSERLDEITLKGFELVHEKHTVQQRVKEFLEHCKVLL